MRNGILIAEDKPHNLINNSGSLEQAFLELCLHDKIVIEECELNDNIRNNNDKIPLQDYKKNGLLDVEFSVKRFKALLKKNFIQISREPT